MPLLSYHIIVPYFVKREHEKVKTVLGSHCCNDYYIDTRIFRAYFYALLVSQLLFSRVQLVLRLGARMVGLVAAPGSAKASRHYTSS